MHILSSSAESKSCQILAERTNYILPAAGGPSIFSVHMPGRINPCLPLGIGVLCGPFSRDLTVMQSDPIQVL